MVYYGDEPSGGGKQEINFISRSCDTLKGSIVFAIKCQKCHTIFRRGVLKPDSTRYIYTPLWSQHSFNTAVELYVLRRMTSFIQKISPIPLLIPLRNYQRKKPGIWQRSLIRSNAPKKIADDWKKINNKPPDYPFVPFADSFTALQHKYGPFIEILKRPAYK